MEKEKVAPLAFDKALRAFKNQKFKEWNISEYGDWRLYLKTIVLFAALPLFYCLAVFTAKTQLAQAACWLGFGITVAGIGMGVMHDASHGAYSSKEWINTVISHIMNLMGADIVAWHYKHVVAHHSEPNVVPVDDDVDMGPAFCIDPAETPKKIHGYQHIYAWPLYCLLNILWIVLFDFKKYFSGHVGSTKIKRSGLNHFIFWMTKLWVIFAFIYVPFHYQGILGLIEAWGIGFGISGLILSCIFQCAHVIKGLPIEHKETYKRLSPQRHQLRETADFDSHTFLGLILSWYVGGLDYQVVHHLFPGISHVHYPRLAPELRKFVKEYAIEHNDPTLVYHRFNSFGEALIDHYLVLKESGQMRIA